MAHLHARACVIYVLIVWVQSDGVQTPDPSRSSSRQLSSSAPLGSLAMSLASRTCRSHFIQSHTNPLYTVYSATCASLKGRTRCSLYSFTVSHSLSLAQSHTRALSLSILSLSHDDSRLQISISWCLINKWLPCCLIPRARRRPTGRIPIPRARRRPIRSIRAVGHTVLGRWRRRGAA